jgi:hypothetical protein
MHISICFRKPSACRNDAVSVNSHMSSANRQWLEPPKVSLYRSHNGLSEENVSLSGVNIWDDV